MPVSVGLFKILNREQEPMDFCKNLLADWDIK
jgi:hypothetical protein